MASLRFPLLGHVYRTAIPYAVALAGALLTVWLAREVELDDLARRDHRFQREAQEQAESITRPFTEHLSTLEIVQRMLHTVAPLDEATLTRILDPLSHGTGLRGFAWAPRVAAAEQAEFERRGKARWGRSFAITALDAQRRLGRAPPRERWFPVEFGTLSDPRRSVVGLDLESLPELRPLIEEAIEEGTPLSSGYIPAALEPFSDRKMVALLVPVYATERIPLHREERRKAIRGLLVATLDIVDLFDVALAFGHGELHVGLFDFSRPEQAVRRWPPTDVDDAPAEPPDFPKYSRVFELAGHLWNVRVEADAAWLAANTNNRAHYVAAAGLLLSLLAFFTLRRLLGRSALAERLERSHGDVLNRQRAAENRASMLAMVVEQSPAAIMIANLRGRIEYVNDMFVEMTGYARDEAIGKPATLLDASGESDGAYREMHEAILANRTWRGELPGRRRDGRIFWERAIVAPIRDPDGDTTHVMAIGEDITELRGLMARLQESENRFRGAMTVMAEGLAVLSRDGVCYFANRAAAAILRHPERGLQRLEARRLPVQFLDPEGDAMPSPLENGRLMAALCARRELRNRVVGLRFRDGAVRWLEVSTSPLRTDEGQPRMVATFSDITERRESEEKSRLAFEAIRHSGEGIVMTDADRRIISANPAFEAMTGYAAAEVIGKTSEILFANHQQEGFLDEMRRSLDSAGHWQGEVWSRRRNGEVYPEWLGISAVREADGRARYYVHIFSDMTERKAAQKRIEFLAHHDPLTELPNRLLLRDRMAQAMARASRTRTRAALMFLDLDRFKKINDSLGHPVGDALLKAIAERLKGCVRESDTISRQGGDEFIIVLGDVRDSEAVARVADKIHQLMGQPFAVGNHSLITSFSIGVALFPDDGEDFDALLQKADTAMYHAKEAGRNSHRFFTEQMNLQVVEHMTLETRLRHALDKGEFVLHYQPQLDLQERAIVGIEALVRWNSPENGLVPPAKFIPVAEESGLIVHIGAWVLREACRQAKAWQHAGLPPLVVAVNLSAIQFRRLDLVNTVIDALVLSDLDSQWLELELTESILLQDTEATLDTVRRLKALGLKLSVDDFGTGYSSLAYLKRFAVDKLKIDRSFVRDLLTDPDDAAIVRAIIQMAHSLKLKTIAEGVESEELCNLLSLFRCDEVQGYWLARPLPADELEAFVRGYVGGNHGEKQKNS
jgi:diguanylate cyclase (GGDEF)-like protein/PAS domain S-box-containing protein